MGEYLQPRLQGYRLIRGRYQGLVPQEAGSLLNPTTGLRLVPEGKRLRLRDAATDELLPWLEEDAVARLAAEREAEQQSHRADQERFSREAAEQRIRALEEELVRLRRGDP